MSCWTYIEGVIEVTPKLCILPKQSSITCHELPDQKEAQSFTSLVRMAIALLPMLTSLTSQAISTTIDIFVRSIPRKGF